MINTGKELEFISWIKRDGSGTENVSKYLIDVMQEDKFEITILSLTEMTFIASGFNCFVVRLKTK